MAVLAGEIVASKTFTRVRYGWTDLVGRIGEQRVSVLAKLAKGIVTDRSNIRWRPLRQINGR